MVPYKRIIFFRTDMLGDTLLNLPTLDALKNAYPASHITLVCHPSLAQFLEGYPSIDRFLPFEAGRRKALFKEWRLLLSQVKRGEFDLAIVSNARKDFHLITFLAGIKRRIGYARKWGFLLTDPLKDDKFLGTRHEIEANLNLVKPLGIRTNDPNFTLPESVQDQEEADKILNAEGIKQGMRFILIHPFSSDSRKCWSVGNFEELIKKIKLNTKLAIAVIGSENEKNRATELIKNNEIINLCGKTNLRTLCGIIRRSILLIGHDSGPMHIASGVGTPTVSLCAKFPGGPNPDRWRPWGSGHTVIHGVLKDLTADEVWKEVWLKLKQHTP